MTGSQLGDLTTEIYIISQKFKLTSKGTVSRLFVLAVSRLKCSSNLGYGAIRYSLAVTAPITDLHKIQRW